jgi:DNA-binding CsgD family transcriptional regulator
MNAPSLLSEREKEVVELLLLGKSNKQIAAALNITIRTVEFHLSNIYNKTGVASRSEAILVLAKMQLRESTGADNKGNLRESTVEIECEAIDNAKHTIQRRIPMKNLFMISVGLLATALLVFLLLSGNGVGLRPHYHSDEEVAQAAMKSATENFDRTEMIIAESDTAHVGTVILNQLLKSFRQRDTHYGIRLVSFEISELDFIEKAEDGLHYRCLVEVVPQDKARFINVFNGLFPYEDLGEQIRVAFNFTVFQDGSWYKLIDVGFEGK